MAGAATTCPGADLEATTFIEEDMGDTYDLSEGSTPIRSPTGGCFGMDSGTKEPPLDMICFVSIDQRLQKTKKSV